MGKFDHMFEIDTPDMFEVIFQCLWFELSDFWSRNHKQSTEDLVSKISW